MVNINKQIRDIIESGNIGDYLPEHLYHATFSGSLDSIKENGLGNFDGGYKSLWRLSYDKGVYLDTDEASAESFVEGSDDDRLDTEEIIIFKIPTNKLTKSLIEIDYNNDWNMDMLDEIEFESIEDYFSKVTYFYNGVIPFADLMVESLNEEQEDVELDKVELTKEGILDLVKSSFKEHGGQDVSGSFYILPDGYLASTGLIDKDMIQLLKSDPNYKESDETIDQVLYKLGMIDTKPAGRYDDEMNMVFEEMTGSIYVYSSMGNRGNVYLNKDEPTEKQYSIIHALASEYKIDSSFQPVKFIVFTKDGINRVYDETDIEPDKVIEDIKRYYTTGKLGESILKEEIDHEEIYDSLTFSNEPDKGPIFISGDGMFSNIGKSEFHSKIFDGEDYEADDYYILHDDFNLIKANGGNRFEPFAYIDLWKRPNPAQKKAIISWMYYLLEWNMFKLQVNTSQNNETYNLLEMIPEDVYRDIIRNL
jgi:hypothetical protein